MQRTSVESSSARNPNSIFILENKTALKKLNSKDEFKNTCTKSKRALINSSALSFTNIEGMTVSEFLNERQRPKASVANGNPKSIHCI